MIFQDPFGSLNPRHTIFQIIGEALEIHFPGFSRSQRNSAVNWSRTFQLISCGSSVATPLAERTPGPHVRVTRFPFGNFCGTDSTTVGPSFRHKPAAKAETARSSRHERRGTDRFHLWMLAEARGQLLIELGACGRVARIAGRG